MRISLFLAAALIVCGCSKDESSAPAPAAAPAPSAPAGVNPEPAASVYPEDRDIDPVADPATRARAKALGAITPQDLKTLKPGADVVALVRGDRGGGTIYGSGPYTVDSSIRKAVVHAGLIKHEQLGIVRLKVIEHPTTHPSVPANGITPTPWGQYHTSYTLHPVDPSRTAP